MNAPEPIYIIMTDFVFQHQLEDIQKVPEVLGWAPNNKAKVY